MSGTVVGRLVAQFGWEGNEFNAGMTRAGQSMREFDSQAKKSDQAIKAAMRGAVSEVDRFTAANSKAKAAQTLAAREVERSEARLRKAREDGNTSKIESAEARLASARARSDQASIQAKEAEAGLAEARNQSAQAADGAAESTEKVGAASEGTRGKLAEMVAGGVAVGAAFGAITTIGMDYTRTMNTLQAVSGATAGQMGQVSAKARELGNDVALPGTSAVDAASAMTELAKGGFSVEQSMDGAKGSLQLAAAAQIDAATAAGIQSAALQAFGKDASFAGRAADILSNTSNASSAEITDVALALQQAGTVANGFGVSMDDTATMIGLFANAGITGSDAGTLLKTGLQSLTDQSDSAQGAIDALGLTVYDSNDKFVGMRSLWEQLATASHNMSDEQFQANTNILFGSDAMRAAMIAAGGGTEAYDKMSASIAKQGTAAELANAKMQGLPGAWERVQNAIESVALSAYGVGEGALTTLANSGADLIGVGDSLVGSLSFLAAPVTALVDGFGALPGPLQTMIALMGVAKVASMLFGGQIASVRGRMSSAATGISGYASALRTSAQYARQATAQTDAMHRSMMRSGQANAQVGALARSMMVMGAQGGALGRIGTSFTNAATGAQRFGNLAGTAAGGMTAMRVGMGGLMGAMGGPWGLAITGAIGALTLWMGKKRQDAQASQEAAARTNSYADALKASGGAIDSNIRTMIANDDAYKGARDSADKLKVSQKDLSDAMVGEGDSAQKLTAELNKVIAAHTKTFTETNQQQGTTKTKTRMDDTAKAATKMRDAIAGSNKELDEAKTKAQRTAEATGDMSTSFDGSKRAVGPMSKSMQDFAESTDSAEDKVGKLAKALDDLNQGALTEEEALQGWSDGMRSLAEALKENGTAAILNNGHLDVTTEKGSKLQDSVVDQAKAFNELAVATLNSAQAQGKTMPQALDVVRAKMTQQRQAFIDAAVAAGAPIEKARSLADAYGLIPDQVVTRLNVQGMANALQGLENLHVKASTIPEGQVKVVDNTPENLAHLRELGLKTTTLPDGRIAITDTSAETINRLNNLGVRTTSLPGGFIKVDDSSPQNLAHLNDIGIKTTTLPNGMVVINADDAAFKAAIANATKPESKQITINYKALGDIAIKPDGTVDMDAQRRKFQRADGAIVPMADGGFRQIRKPTVADIYAGRGDGTIFAEEETGGEAYIPLAPGKRDRSVGIMSEVARLFGMALVRPMADGGVNAGYGLPAGSTGGFPDWVTALGAQYGVKPSTYAGHQESNRTEPGYAPNPQGLNRGIDWGGSTAQMQTFAEAMYARAQSDPAIEQIIWQNPETGEKIGWHGRSPDTDGSYFASDYPAHQNHVHLRLAAQLAAAGGAAGAAGQPGVRTVPIVQNPDGTWTSTDPAWAALMKRESGGDMKVVQKVQDGNSGGNEASGGFQIAKQTWAANGGLDYAPTAGEADPEDQAIVAARIFDKSGGNPWGAGMAGREDEAALRAGITTKADPTAGLDGAASGSGQPVFVTNWPASYGTSTASSTDSASTSSPGATSSGTSSTGSTSKSSAGSIAKAGNKVTSASTAVDTAKRRQADAEGRLRVAQTRLTEVQQNPKAKRSQIESAENAVAKARRDSEAAANKVTIAEQKLTGARDGLAKAQTAPGATATKNGDLGRIGPLRIAAYANGAIEDGAPSKATMLNRERMWITRAGEAGPEVYIPMNNSPRSKALWLESGQRMGMLEQFGDGGFGGYTVDTRDAMAPKNFYDLAAIGVGGAMTAASAIAPYVGMAQSGQVSLGDLAPTIDTANNTVPGAEAIKEGADAMMKPILEALKQIHQAVSDGKNIRVTVDSDNGPASHVMTRGRM